MYICHAPINTLRAHHIDLKSIRAQTELTWLQKSCSCRQSSSFSCRARSCLARPISWTSHRCATPWANLNSECISSSIFFPCSSCAFCHFDKVSIFDSALGGGGGVCALGGGGMGGRGEGGLMHAIGYL